MEHAGTQQKKIRAALYLRCSTDEQKLGYGLAVQEDKLRAFCKSQMEEYVVSDDLIYRDEGFSGSLDVKQRPALARLFDDAENGKLDVVVVYRIDRFFRNTRHLLNSLEILKSYNIPFQSATESFNTNEVAGRLLLKVLASVADAERETTRERTMSGKLKAATQGKFVTGVPPYGYNVDKPTKKLIVVPEQAKIIKKIFRWVVDEKLPLREIEKRMNQMKVPPPYNTRYKKKQTLNYWHRRTIGRLLTNETFTGTFYYRKYQRPFNNLTSITDKRKLRPRDEWIEMSCPAIITREMFEAAKQQLLKNREFAKRNRKRSYLYSQLIHCGKCGFKMFGGFQPSTMRWPNAGGKYYHGTYRNDKAVGVSKRCEWCPQYSETRLDPIWECLKEILKNPKNMFDPLEKYIYREENPENVKERLEQIDVELSSVREKQSRADELYINGQIDQPKYKEHSSLNGLEEKKLNDEAARLRQSLLTKKEKAEREVAIKQAYDQIKERLDSVSYDEKSEIIRLFVERITLHAREDYASVVFKFPGSTETATVKLGERVSQESRFFPLVLNIRTVSELERRRQIMAVVNQNMRLPKTLV